LRRNLTEDQNSFALKNKFASAKERITWESDLNSLRFPIPGIIWISACGFYELA
jgi:hypothetical protein